VPRYVLPHTSDPQSRRSSHRRGRFIVEAVRIPILALLVGAFLAIPATAQASLADEQRQGQALITQLQAGTRTCGDLSADDLDHIGEYVMHRAVGSTGQHQAMNDRMTAMMGEQGESRMHQLLGRRYTACFTNGPGASGHGWMMGPGMMRDSYGPGGLSAMMSGDWSWMTGAAWQTMTRQDWQGLQQRLLGTTADSSNGRGGWSQLALVATIVGAVALVALAVLAVISRPFRRPPAGAASRPPHGVR
jgi:hypothetical protein